MSRWHTDVLRHRRKPTLEMKVWQNSAIQSVIDAQLGAHHRGRVD
ncbi:hypothetical protein [Stieleria mannarensis]|nr:hypothetical protein [Rhodopirellula sp. JC639]